MKLISKKEVQKLRESLVDKANLEKNKVDQALSESIRALNEWKEKRKNEELKIEMAFKKRMERYNKQIDDLASDIAILTKQREKLMIPVEKLLKETEKVYKENLEQKDILDKSFKKVLDIDKRNKEILKLIDEKEKRISKREFIVKKAETNLKAEKESIKIENNRLNKEKMDFNEYKTTENSKIQDKLDEIRIKNDEIKSQIAVNKEQKLQNIKDQAKLLSDRQALNSAWEELKKLKEKYDRR